MYYLINKITKLRWPVLFIAASMIAGQALGNEDAHQPAILVVGDSLSAAYNMELSQAWPSLLQTRLNQDGYDWRVFNSSITGDTTEGGLARLPRLLERTQPRVVVIELGGNDGLRGLPLEVTRANMARMIELSQQTGARVVLTGIRIPPNYGRDYVASFESMYGELAQEYGTGLVPFFMEGVALEPRMMQADGIHPSVQAQPVLMENIWPELESLLGQPGNKRMEGSE